MTAASGKYPKVMVTGHSLGGAMATVAAYDFALVHGITIFGLYTQGSPRVFETRTRNYLESIRTFPVWRSTFGEDPVPRIPFDAMNFQHVGVELHGIGSYLADGTGTLSKQLEGDGSGEDADTEAAKGLFSTSIGDHGLGPGNYLMHGGAYLVSTTASPCTAGKNVPKDYGYDSCEAKCAAKTGASGNKILGNGPACWLFGSSSDCDTQCPSGYCSYAHVRFTVAPAASPRRVPGALSRPPRRTIPAAGLTFPAGLGRALLLPRRRPDWRGQVQVSISEIHKSRGLAPRERPDPPGRGRRGVPSQPPTGPPPLRNNTRQSRGRVYAENRPRQVPPRCSPPSRGHAHAHGVPSHDERGLR